MISTKRRIEYALGYLILGMKADAKSELDHIPFDEWNGEVQMLRTELSSEIGNSFGAPETMCELWESLNEVNVRLSPQR